MKFKVHATRTVIQALDAEVELELTAADWARYNLGEITDQDLECWAYEQATDSGDCWYDVKVKTEDYEATKL